MPMALASHSGPSVCSTVQGSARSPALPHLPVAWRLTHRALTLIEALIVITVIALVFAFVVLPWFARPRARASRTNCVTHLKQVGIAFHLYASDNGDRFPVNVFTNELDGANWSTAYLRTWWLMSNDLSTPKVLLCPSDHRSAATNFAALALTNASYFLSFDAEEAKPQRILAGDRHLQTNRVKAGPGPVWLRTNSVVDWTTELHPQKGGPPAGYLAFSDGSVQAVLSPRLRQLVAAGGPATNRLLVP